MVKDNIDQNQAGSHDGDSGAEVGLEHVVYELRMLRKEMEGYYANLFKAQELMLTAFGDFFALWMETVKSGRLRGR